MVLAVTQILPNLSELTQEFEKSSTLMLAVDAVLQRTLIEVH